MLLLISVHPSPRADLLTPGIITFSPGLPVHVYRDSFGNDCTRISAPSGRLTISTRFDIADSGLPDVVNVTAGQVPVQDLPDDAMVYLLGSRYCETDRLSDAAWSMFGQRHAGLGRACRRSAISCTTTFSFDYQEARSTRTAAEAYQEGAGVCRDFAHLAIAFCRCMNIPARYCTGYLGDIGVPRMDAPGDFSAWFEAYLGGSLVHLRCTPQHPAYRAHPDGARTGCYRCGYFQ